MTWRENLFAGSNVLVTGGTSGIGARTALRFAELGATVVAAGLNAAGENAPRDDRVRVIEADVTDSAAMRAIFAPFDVLDILICCAGVSRDRDEYDLDVFADVLNVNLISTMRTAEAGRSLLSIRGGSITFTSSMYSVFGASDRPGYSASKGGVTQLTKSLAVEYAGDNIRVNAVAPGWIDTPLSKALQADPVSSARILARTPMHRWGNPDDVADAYVFLASQAAKFVTGVTLPVDGGYLTL